MAASSSGKDLYIRLSVKDAEAAKAALRAFGKEGEAAFKRIEQGAPKASKGMLALDAGSRSLQASMGGFAGRLGVAGDAMMAFGPAGLAAAAGIGILTVGLTRSLRVAADVAEQMSKFKVVFGDNAAGAEAWATSFGRGVNRSRYELMNFMATFQDTFVPLGYARFEAAKLSEQLTRLAVDMASFNNKSEPETVAALTSAIVGNHEAVRQFGIVITEATLKQELHNLGLADSIQKATESQKVQARLSLIMKGTADAQGDAARTADSYVNKVRGLDAAVTDLQVSMGNLLLGPATGVVTFFTDIARTADWAVTSISNMGGAIDQKSTAVITERISEINTEIADLFGKIDALSEKPWLSPWPDHQISGWEKKIKSLAADADLLKSALHDNIATPPPKPAPEKSPVTPTVSADDRTRALKALADLEDRSAKSSLTTMQWLGREKAAELAKYAKLEKDGVLRSEETLKAKFSIEQYYAAQVAKENERLAKENEQARTRALDHVEKYSDRRLTSEKKTVDLIARERTRELKLIDDQLKDRALKEEEAARARADVNAYWDKQAREKTFGGAAQKEIEDYFDTLANAGQRAGQFVVGAFGSMEDALAGFYRTGKIDAHSFFDSLKSGLAKLAAQDTISAIGGLFGIGGGSGGSVIGSVVGAAASGVKSFFSGLFAEGGQVRGPGTGTSDSIVARVSDGEYIVNAAATSKYLPLLEAINSGGIAGFARGGQVGANDNLPRFAFGGAAERAGQRASKEGMGDGGRFISNYSTSGKYIGVDLVDRLILGPDVHTPGFYIDNYGTNENKLMRVSNAQGVVVDAYGGSLIDRITSFFGGNTDTGFLGSRGAGAMISMVGALIGGIPGMVASAAANFARAQATGGLALGTGVGGWLESVSRTGLNASSIFAGLGSPVAGNTGTGTAFARGSREGMDHVAKLAANDTAARLSIDAGSYLSGELDSLRGRLSRDYQPVRDAGARVIRALKNGGGVGADETVIVGDGGEPELFTPGRPGTVTPLSQAGSAIGGADLSALTERLDTLNQTLDRLARAQAATNANLEAFAHATTQVLRTRRTAVG